MTNQNTVAMEARAALLIPDALIEALLRKNYIFLPIQTAENVSVFTSSANPGIARETMLLNADLLQAGYQLSARALQLLTPEYAIAYYDFIINSRSSALSDARYDFVPFYEDFPKGVIERSHEEMLANQILHYLSNGAYMPASEYKADCSNIRVVRLFDGQKRQEIDVITLPEVYRLVGRLCASQNALSPTDREIVKLAGETFSIDALKEYLPETVPFKETLCLLMDAWGLEPRSMTDVLRYAVYKDGGNIELTEPHTWSAAFFTRPMRRRLMEMMETVIAKYWRTNIDAPSKQITDELMRRREEFIHFVHHIHLGDRRNYIKGVHRYPHMWKVFCDLRNDKFPTTLGLINAADKNLDLDAVMNYYRRTPGEFARRLNYLTGRYGAKALYDWAVAYNDLILDRCSFKVLYDLADYFGRRHKMHDYGNRVIRLKNGKTHYCNEPLSKMSIDESSVITEWIENAFTRKISDFCVPSSSAWQALENKVVVLDMQCDDIPLPKAERTAALDSRIPAPVGTIFRFDEDKYLRFNLHWYDARGNEDYDLHAVFFGENFEKQEAIAWNHGLRSVNAAGKLPRGVHSGDVRHKKGACAEYVDINVEEALESGYRYVVIGAVNYDRVGFGIEHGACPVWCGWQTRSTVENDDAKQFKFDATFIQNAYKVVSPVKSIIPVIIDLKRRAIMMVNYNRGSNAYSLDDRDAYKGIVKKSLDRSISTYSVLNAIINTLNKNGANITVISPEDYMKALAEGENSPLYKMPIVDFSFDQLVNDYSQVMPIIYPFSTNIKA